MSTKSERCFTAAGSSHPKIRDAAGQAARKAVRAADRAAPPDGSLWRAGTVLANDGPVPQWRLWLVTGQMRSLRKRGQHSAGPDPVSERHPDLETGGEMVMPEGALCAPVHMIKLTAGRKLRLITGHIQANNDRNNSPRYRLDIHAEPQSRMTAKWPRRPKGCWGHGICGIASTSRRTSVKRNPNMKKPGVCVAPGSLIFVRD
jgi:hypothetical protein